jgi:cytochrome c biogenesis protein CcmG, thiol:disulfide interchange protein DsbE
MTGRDRTKSKASRETRRAQAIRRERIKKLQWAAVAVVVVVVLAAVAIGSGSGDDSPGRVERASIGGPAPDIEMIDFDGEPLVLSEYRGTPVVLNFWATWCPFCIAEMPDFEKVSQSLLDEVVFLGVNLQDERGQAVALADDTGVTYRLADDPTGAVYGAFGGTSMPTTVFIDADGTVRELVGGQMSETQLRDAIQRSFGVGV